MVPFSFKSIISLQGYHVYKKTTWSDAKIDYVMKVDIETDQISIASDPYECAIKARYKYFFGVKNSWGSFQKYVTVGGWGGVNLFGDFLRKLQGLGDGGVKLTSLRNA